jgi:hypothetical protein
VADGNLVTSSAQAIEMVSRSSNGTRHLEDALRLFAGGTDVPLMDEDELLQDASRALPEVVISWSPTASLLTRLASGRYTRIHRFAVLPSRKRARWLLPQIHGRHPVDGFEIYAPFSPSGRLMKAITVKLRATAWHGWVRDSVLIASRAPLPVESLVSDVTGETQFIFSLSLGTPGTFQKLTVQVMSSDGSILGYLKMPLTDGALKRLRHEGAFLRKLSGFPNLQDHIPRLLFAGPWRGIDIVFQSPLEGETGPVRFTQLHEEFLQKLQSCQPSVSPAAIVIEDTARKWERIAPRLGARWQNLGQEALRIATQELRGTVVPCGIQHGDLAPWNTRLHQGRLSIFDWESAASNAPNLWDKFHFLAQTECFLNKKYEAGEQADLREQNRGLYLLYLLHSTAQTAEEEAKQFAIDYREEQMIQHIPAVTRRLPT